MPIDEILKLTRDGGSLLLLVVAVVGGFKGWYVWRWHFDSAMAQCSQELERVRKERDEWKDLALRGISVAERVTS